MMRRLLATVLLLLLICPTLQAQGTRKVPRVGIVSSSAPDLARRQIDAFRDRLRELGYVEGQNILIEERLGEATPDRFRELIADLQRSSVDVLVVAGAIGAREAKQATATTPVVFVAVTDPIGSGVVSSLARPGGNLTGTSLFISEELAGKWVELVKDAVPRISTVAALVHTEHPMTPMYVKGMESASRTLGLKLQVIAVPNAKGLDDALGKMAKAPPGALIVAASPFFSVHRRKMADVAQQRRIPSIGYDIPFVVDGFLMSYGASIADAYRRAAVYVDRILKGARPADLPIEQATKFELAVNLKTARALGLTIPPSMLNRADHVIE